MDAEVIMRCRVCHLPTEHRCQEMGTTPEEIVREVIEEPDLLPVADGIFEVVSLEPAHRPRPDSITLVSERPQSLAPR